MQKRFVITLASILLSTVTSSRAFAQEHNTAPVPHSDAMTSSESSAEATTAVPHLSADAGWVPPMLIIIAGLFLAARVIGPAVRAEMVEEAAADSHGHDDHGHGHDAHAHGH